MTTLSRRPYRPSSTTIEAYTQGDCWHLAHAIHQRTGWPMIFADPTDLRASARYWEHAAVVMPCGRVLDIEGVRTRREWKQRWGAARVTVVSSSAAIRADWIGDQERLFTTQTAAVAARLLRGITREKHAAAHP